jgi:uncharacterized Zn finger protein (UPF0148 family)
MLFIGCIVLIFIKKLLKKTDTFFNEVQYTIIQGETMRNCPGCGKELNKDYDFCPYCSYELKEYGEEDKRLDAEFEAMDNDKDLNVRDNKKHISDEENEKLKPNNHLNFWLVVSFIALVIVVAVDFMIDHNIRI